MTAPAMQLTRVRVEGFRSLKDVTLDLGPITVVIGPNGAGKSNLLTALRLPPLMRTQVLRRFVGEQGGASKLLHYGPETTRELGIALEFKDGPGRKCYEVRLGYAAGDSLVFVAENLFLGTLTDEEPKGLQLGTGHTESQLGKIQLPSAASLAAVPALIGRMSFFHFHDTSLTSPLRQNATQADSKCVRSDGSNLAAYLYRIKRSESEEARAAWTLFEGLVRRIAPFINALEPDLVAPDRADASAVRLYWSDERGHRFDAHDLSDGTLRAIALFAALTQPPATRPKFLTIDEPELGLHPAAISIFAGLVRSASAHSQILVATQSPALLDEFAPDEVVVAERRGGETTFTRLDPKELEAWLEDYSLSQLYDKNVLGGRP
ncbi:AAA family ATPase [Sorangium sp. So ce291]|uniref:AAA family ATPase n=1 Tax=Sorangium sp. So ce291 TaxID=3133294 RepID=UPI003F61658A